MWPFSYFRKLYVELDAERELFRREERQLAAQNAKPFPQMREEMFGTLCLARSPDSRGWIRVFDSAGELHRAARTLSLRELRFVADWAQRQRAALGADARGNVRRAHTEIEAFLTSVEKNEQRAAE
jgi:hypothetical protein